MLKKVESLKSEGYPAELAQSNPDGCIELHMEDTHKKRSN